MAWIGNRNRDSKKGRPFTPADFDPYAEPKSQAKKLTTDAILDLKRILVPSGD